jgi:hypothetical protein
MSLLNHFFIIWSDFLFVILSRDATYRYLMLPHYLSELELKVTERDPSQRLERLRASLSSATEFLRTCTRLEIIDSQVCPLIHA